ncbi:GTP-binding protein [Romboutsia sp. CE17]|uniref:dynamin family protein n=1 Tax=Romboutsia sp. CE17 TaxID=2724150 RepID=UPI001442DF32|nr:dynamin family protein [Romboutsia sp. CE17]QJA08259.1 GTP-binding protein [Romboutsia sp. CE17]
MKEINECIQEVKLDFLRSPLRTKLSQEENIPFKNLVIKNLNNSMDNLELLEINKTNPLKIVIVGEVKSGKSTLVNALLEKDISKTDVLEATSSILEVTYGEKYDTKIVDCVTKIYLDLDILKKINIVDTPGLRSITTKNETKTLNYIQNADFIVFVIDATHIGQEDIINTLDIIESLKKPIIGVINKCDLLQDDKDEVLEYINEEYGLYIDKFFLISSYLEYEAKIKNDYLGDIESIKEEDYKELRENYELLKNYIDELYRNSNGVKEESLKSSLQGIIQKEIILNYDYYKSISILSEEILRYENILRNKLDYVTSKMNFEIDDWIDRIFFYDQINKINNNLEYANEYINESYINKCINEKKDELDKLFFNEWEECIREVQYEINNNINKSVERVYYKDEFLNNTHYKIDKNDLNLNEILASVGTGAILGVTSGGIASVYAAAVGSSAASVTISSALMIYCPPLLIAGTICGAVGKIIYDKLKSDKSNKDMLQDIEKFIAGLRESIKIELKSNYYKCSEEIINTSCEIFKKEKNINMSKYELEEFINNMEKYVEGLNKYIRE